MRYGKISPSHSLGMRGWVVPKSTIHQSEARDATGSIFFVDSRINRDVCDRKLTIMRDSEKFRNNQ